MRSFQSVLEQIAQTKAIPDTIAVGAGAVKGYLDALGVPVPSTVAVTMKYAPMGLQGIIGGYTGLVRSVSDEDNRTHTKEVLKGSASGVVLGAIEVGLGYCIGYTAGSLTK